MTKRVVVEARRLSVKGQAFAVLAALVSAVALPQIVHVSGAALGIGTSLGEMLLPMHLPILLVGLLAGPWAGGIAGFLAPLVSFALTGMPGQAMLPFIVIELCVYGLASGLLRQTAMPTLGKVLVAQVTGRAVRGIAIVMAGVVLGISAVPVSVIWTSLSAGICGMALQWLLIPVVVRWVEKQDAE